VIGLKNRESLDSTVADEFENLVSQFRAVFLVEHTENGEHLASPEVTNFVPSGAIMPYAGSAAPSNWFLCDGAQVNRLTYQRLFNVIGTTYGAGDGLTTFNLPDIRQRFILGKALAGTGAVLGSTGGAIDHDHTGGSHTHTIASQAGHQHTAGTLVGPSHSHAAGTLAGGSHSHTIAHTHTYSGTTSTGSNENEEGGFFGSGSYLWDTQAVDHTHDYSGTTSASSAANSGSQSVSISGSTAAEGTGAVTGSTASNSAHDHGGVTGGATGSTGTNNPAFITLNHIIKS